MKTFYVLLFYSTENPVEAILLKDKGIETLSELKFGKNVMVVSKRVKSMSKRVKSTFQIPLFLNCYFLKFDHIQKKC